VKVCFYTFFQMMKVVITTDNMIFKVLVLDAICSKAEKQRLGFHSSPFAFVL